MTEPVIQALTPERLDDFLAYFDGDAFAEGNTRWAGCTCYFYHTPADSAEAWVEACKNGSNRAGAAELIRRGQMHGYLAYADGRVVGWCHAAPRHTLPNLGRALGTQLDPGETVGSIVCFNIAAPYRRTGLAGRLLAAACAGFAHLGLSVAEAYPQKAPVSVLSYHGPLVLYEAAGFSRAGELEHCWVYRKVLTGPG